MSSQSATNDEAAHREDQLAQRYERARPRLIQVAYSVLGRRGEAEDVVSEAWLRLVAADRREPVTDVEAWATVVVARAALDVLRSARVRREVYVGPWLPEPIIEKLPGGADPADRVTLDEAVSFGLMVMLESLTPAERTAFVLHDLFGMPSRRWPRRRRRRRRQPEGAAAPRQRRPRGRPLRRRCARQRCVVHHPR